MSDIEEPAAKISKLDDQDMAEGEDMDNGQEEWLSEDILTDDDYNPAVDQDQSDSNANTSQEEGNDSMDQASQDTNNTAGENIEQTLNQLENTMCKAQAALPEELGAFLIRKTDVRMTVDEPKTKEPDSELDESTKQSEDDGNDTDDLLRMLGEDNGKKKEASATRTALRVRPKDTPHSSDDDDDEYIFEDTKMTRVKSLKNNVQGYEQNSKVSTVSKFKAVKVENKDVGRSRKIASKAVAEDMSDPDEDSVPSSDEAVTVKKMFDVRRTKVVTTGLCGLGPRGRGINAVKTVTSRVISIDPKGPSMTSVPLKPPVKTPAKLLTKGSSGITILPMKAKGPVTRNTISTAMDKTSLDDIGHEEHSNEDFQDMESDAEEEEGGQRLMRPEQMDEEVPSDAESHSEEDSYYDEMPSSESEDADDWFTLDIRAERAAEYIPMLGEDAKALLTAEEQRAAARLGALRRSASALVAGRRTLTTQLRQARTTLAQIEAALAQ